MSASEKEKEASAWEGKNSAGKQRNQDATPHLGSFISVKAGPAILQRTCSF